MGNSGVQYCTRSRQRGMISDNGEMFIFFFFLSFPVQGRGLFCWLTCHCLVRGHLPWRLDRLWQWMSCVSERTHRFTTPGMKYFFACCHQSVNQVSSMIDYPFSTLDTTRAKYGKLVDLYGSIEEGIGWLVLEHVIIMFHTLPI